MRDLAADLAAADVRPRVGSAGHFATPDRGPALHRRLRAGGPERRVAWATVTPTAEIALSVTVALARLASPAGSVAALPAGMRTLDGCVLSGTAPRHRQDGAPVTTASREAHDADGDLTTRLAGTCPHVPLCAAEELGDAATRAWFFERVFAHARLRAFLESEWRPRDLVAFHSRHKLQLLAHSPESYRALGRTVAGAGARGRKELATEYGAAFRAALARPATVGRHVNALQHALGMLGTRRDEERCNEIRAAIAAYREGTAPLRLPRELLYRHSTAIGASWVGEQTYLAPYTMTAAATGHATPPPR